MQAMKLGHSERVASRLAYGCMRIEGNAGKRAVHAAIEAGYTLFDHADIYGDGACETLFGEVLRESPGLREQILIQSKCGVQRNPARYDLSREHIINSVEGSLARLGIEQLDLYLLHRPDLLMHAEEIARAVSELTSSGKIAAFGVSNFSVTQVELLNNTLDQPIVVNQVEINLHNVDALRNGVLDQCQRLGIAPQAWSPLAAVAFTAWGNSFDEEDNARIRAELDRQAGIYGQDPWLIVLAWLLKHPAGISPIIGSTTPERIAAAVAALDIDYSREDWYSLLVARDGHRLP